MKLFAAVVALGLSMCADRGMAQGSEWIGTYGLISKVVWEPNAENPQRMQVFGVFALANPEDSLAYLAPQSGYLYFTLPAGDKEKALKEWAHIQKVSGKGTVLGFGQRSSAAALRVRKLDEKPAAPEVYSLGLGKQWARRGAVQYPQPVSALFEFETPISQLRF